MSFLICTTDPETKRLRQRATEPWKDTALSKAGDIAERFGEPVQILQVRSRGGVPKLVETVYPRRADYRLTFVHAETGRVYDGIDYPDVPRAFVVRRCEALLPAIALRFGVAVARVKGEISDCVPAEPSGECAPPAALVSL